MSRSNVKASALLIGIAFAIATISIWAWLNRPEAEPEWPRKVWGFALSPFQANQNAIKGDFPTDAQIGQDLDILKDRTQAIRSYTVDGTIGDLPALAAERGLNVTLGLWIDGRRDHNEAELTKGIALAAKYRNVARVMVGNESVLRGDMPLPEFLEVLDRARDAIQQPISTAEPWHVWISHPELAEHVDFITIHLLPYWEGIQVEQAVDYSIQIYNTVKLRFPNKLVVIGEVGWPSNGRTREKAVASESNEALFLRRFLAWAERENVPYYIEEAFDQPWKADEEGAVGAYWGVYDANRKPKFEFDKPIERLRQWQMLAAISVVLAGAMLFWFYRHSGTLKNRGRSFLALISYSTSALTTWVVYSYTQQYLNVTNVTVGIFLFIGMLGVIAVLLAEAHEWAEAHWVRLRRRLLFDPKATALMARDYQPKVSIHVPAYNEPPDMMIETLNALAQLDYPNFEVLVIDNNTPDESTWRPVEAHCATLGPRFRFFHVKPLAGFKAGALNFALRHTASDVEIIAVIDSDYAVAANWLQDLVPTFLMPKMAIVQAPQDYRDDHQNAFKAMCHAEYRGFFHIGMVTRNERNAIIQHGTMTMVRHKVLKDLGGWAEWCITEDAELGLRVFEAGLEATYIPHSYGKGVMPDTFIDFKKQRFRWAYGAMQILRAHSRELLGQNPKQLTIGQRYHFLAGWLPWLADGFNVIFNVSALVWSTLMVIAPAKFDAPLAIFSALPLSLFVFKLAKLMHLYKVRVGAGFKQTIAASIAGLGLAHTIGIAVLKGLFTNNEPFFRTPKQALTQSLQGALLACRTEAIMAIGLWASAVAVTLRLSSASVDRMRMDSPDLRTWVLAMLVQSIPYLSAVIASIISSMDLPAHWVGTGYQHPEGDEDFATFVEIPSTGSSESLAATVKNP
jgi:exo-beta-1,3-glucanase (GH17 family)/cellulose synthase/poly-beta-1,6-N-acetylglucosamine synthase-like glycosyltransferase